ncbi:hypothetical protein TSAR_016309 [Trichomalopsis sarcophagae]|uniref:Reverse transcriptase zinc-binding domain-containing protein n=1 Tax=Trichomalopsis sarcophagae TaxID=543379 RepID=A0A232ELY0_9HYME|nr:hypothetical protein TSAR_016309 [Trichomalopsis sarcophagae]
MRDLSRAEAKIFTQLITGHGTLGYHQHIIGRVNSPTCKWCNQNEESSIHVLCHCLALAEKRYRALGMTTCEPTAIQSLTVRKEWCIPPDTLILKGRN